MKIAYSHLVKYIQENPTIKELSDSLFQLGHEHEILENIFDIEFTPNRGDCLSINGLLRDLGVFYNVNFDEEVFSGPIEKLEIEFENLSKKICPKISFIQLEIEEIPKQYKSYLDNYFSELNIKKNNFFADISNYLSYETGQPTHCYDAKSIKNKIIFHESELKEEFETLLDKKITLEGKNAVFSSNGEVINLAGIVGGKSTACLDDTKMVLVECAYFEPEAIIGKSIKYDIHSDASYKFERNVDYDSQEKILRRFIKIVSEHTNIKNVSYISYEYIEKATLEIPVDVNKINKILGTDVAEKDYLDYLKKLGFYINNGLISIPSFRNDIKTQNDLAEEIARVIGYDNILINEIIIPKNEESNYKNIENKLRYFLLDHGFYEVINAPFVSHSSKEAIKVDNPLDSNRKFIRTNITSSLLENLLFNERRQKIQ